MCSAVNILTWCKSGPSGEAGAEWIIFHTSDIPKLVQILRRRADMQEDDPRRNPTHFQRVYVDETILQELRNTGVIPFRFVQKAGQAVFIPSGAPHQV